MKHMLRGLILAFAALLGLTSPARAEWHEARTEHVTVYGDMSPDALRSYAERLELFDAALRRITSARETPRVTIYVLPSMADIRRLAGGSSVAGFYTASAQSAQIFLSHADPSQGHSFGMRPAHILFHEYAHHMLLSNVDEYLPGWANEGMAELFSTVRIDNEGLTFGAPSLNRGFGANSMNRMSLEELLLSDSRRLSPEQNEQKYSRGWLLIHYLLLSGNRPGQFARYVTLLNQAVPVLDAARQAFGDLGALDREFDRYRRAPRFQGFRVTRAQLGGTPQVTTRRLQPGEAAIMPLRIESAAGVDAREAQALLGPARAVAARFPQDSYVQRALAEMEWDAGNLNEAEAAADRAIALDPNNLEAFGYKVRVLGRRAFTGNGGARGWREVRTWISRANRTNPNYALPLVQYYDTFIASGEPVTDVARNGLLRALILVPQDSSLRVRVAMDRLRAGDMASARRALAPIAFSAHSGPENPARKLIQMIDANETKEAILAAAAEAHLGGHEFQPPRPPEEPAARGRRGS